MSEEISSRTRLWFGNMLPQQVFQIVMRFSRCLAAIHRLVHELGVLLLAGLSGSSDEAAAELLGDVGTLFRRSVSAEAGLQQAHPLSALRSRRLPRNRRREVLGR